MNRRALYFVAAGVAEVRAEPMAPPAPGELLIATRLSAISPGTEMLVYRCLLYTSRCV